ncbi:hypothetical protein [Bradyrhizobium iriomotense]|uniref:Lectin-like protein BA14k n=1 Tax=Bradyrhizobium iriomotense TaxID=441950 RepID=A0ABQ6AM51_9BRAD|nr:hypothetical protein [Bradyrhizobium iriomotense]GLR83334.1 hypothetical protein GCM10007857_00440 [Bradyrhizobium iriomotense]
MTSLRLLGAAALLASALATPAFAQMANDPNRCAGLFQDPACQNVAPGTATGRHYRHSRAAYRQAPPNDQTGFWPADAAAATAGAAVGTAAAVTGAAVGTAGAIATAPFGGWNNSYASYDQGGTGWHGDWNSYAARNGIVCRPGTWIKGDDGRRHLCQ